MANNKDVKYNICYDSYCLPCYKAKSSFSKGKIIFCLIAFVSLCLVLCHMYSPSLKRTNGMALAGKTVIIDAGHGGMDPGETGNSGLPEAELNLMITHKVKSYLEASGAYVLLTRKDKNALYDPSAKNKKKDDLTKRREYIENSNATILISIHQNSFTDSKYKGAQVFYPKDHDISRVLAQNLQDSLKRNLDPENNRQIKSEKYYILEKPLFPTVICECGFLTNQEEEKNLNNELYQEKVAWAIYEGINNYFANV